MSELRNRPRVNAAIEGELEDGACMVEDLALAPNALPPPWALLVEDVLTTEDDGRTSRQYADGSSWPYAPWEVIL